MFGSFRHRSRVAVWLVGLLALFAANARVTAADWTQVRPGILYAVSGMALLQQQGDRTEFLVVHDNKWIDEPRLGVVTAVDGKVTYRALAWPKGANYPVDLESISAVPEQTGQFLALTSGGRLFWLGVANGKVVVRATFMLPELPREANLEGFSAQRLGDRLVAVWGHRGAGVQPGILFWGLLDLENKQITAVSKTNLTVPFPSPSDRNTRHISDLKLDVDGVVWGAAANDPGDDGPFVSAIYTLGVLRVLQPQTLQFEPDTHLTRLWTFQKKVEALELVPGPQGAIAFGTDDENNGGWLYFDQAASSLCGGPHQDPAGPRDLGNQ
jgi:hypothetical protein